jgi:hypothetical protein
MWATSAPSQQFNGAQSRAANRFIQSLHQIVPVTCVRPPAIGSWPDLTRHTQEREEDDLWSFLLQEQEEGWEPTTFKLKLVSKPWYIV